MQPTTRTPPPAPTTNTPGQEARGRLCPVGRAPPAAPHHGLERREDAGPPHHPFLLLPDLRRRRRLPRRRRPGRVPLGQALPHAGQGGGRLLPGAVRRPPAVLLRAAADRRGARQDRARLGAQAAARAPVLGGFPGGRPGRHPLRLGLPRLPGGPGQHRDGGGDRGGAHRRGLP